MKKAFAILLAVLLPLLLAACSFENPLIGSWEMKTSYEALAGTLPTEEELGNLAG